MKFNKDGDILVRKMNKGYREKKKYRGFYKNFFGICLLLVLQNVVTISINLADNMMLGAYSETALSGVAAVNQIQFVYQQILMALGDGAVIVCSQYWGKGLIQPMKRICAFAMYAGLLTALVLFLIVSVFPKQTLGLFTIDDIIVEEGVSYLCIIRFTYPFFAVTILLLATLRSTGNVKIAFWLSVMTFLINCGLNSVFIYGRFGAPEMGAAGAAVGTLCARIAECITLIFYVIRGENHLKLKLTDYFQIDRALIKDYLKIAAPILLVQTLWGLNTALQTVVLGHMTSEAIAANSIASTLFLLVKSAAVGASATASVIIGKSIGSGDLELVKVYSRLMQRIFLLIGIVGGVLLFWIRIPILRLYNLTPDTMEMANQFLIILCVVFVGMSYQMPTNNGIIRGGGNPMFVVKMDLVSIWMIVLPISFVMAFVVKASPAIVVCCLNADQIFKCIPGYLMSNYGNWIRKLTRE